MAAIQVGEFSLEFRYFFGDGTFTTAYLVKDGKVVAAGSSRCCPKDRFCKEVGRSKALERLGAVLPQKTRETVMKAYLGRKEIGNDKT